MQAAEPECRSSTYIRHAILITKNRHFPFSVSPVCHLGMNPSICERVTPRLSHANSAVVLSAVKVLMKFMEMLSKDLDYYGTLLKKLAPPLVTLLSAEPELQYVALRNINLIVQKRYCDCHTCCVYSWEFCC